jgi:hypothetical protein
MVTFAYRFSSLIIIVFLLTISVFSQSNPQVEAQGLTAKINWRVHSNPTNGIDAAYSVCETKEYIYVVGHQRGTARVEMRFKSNGSLVKDWNSTDFSSLVDCVFGNNRLYVVTDDRKILMFDLSLNLLNFKHSNLSVSLNSIAFYDNNLYLAGRERVKDDDRWRVEKYRAENLTLIKEYTANPTPIYYDEAFIASMNPVTKQLWVVGVQNSDLRVEVFDLDLNLVNIISRNYGYGTFAIDFDEDGYAYISSNHYIIKYDKYGDEVTSKAMPNWVYKLLYSNGYLYVGTVEWVTTLIGGYNRQILYIFDKNLNQIERIILGRSIRGHAWFDMGKMAFDGKNLYVAGSNEVRVNQNQTWDTEWNIYSITFVPKEQTTNSIMWIFTGSAIITIIVISTYIYIRRRKAPLRPTIPPPSTPPIPLATPFSIPPTAPILYCPRCRSVVYLGDIYCGKCGKKLKLTK